MRISHSRIKSWRRCQKQHDYKYNQRLKKKAPPVPLLRGRILGEGLDAMAQKQSPAKVLDKYEREYRRLFREEQEMYGSLIEDCRAVLNGYARTYAGDTLHYEHIEAELEFPLTEEITFVGFIDKVATDKQGRRWLADHKSHRTIPGDDQRAADIQSVFYYWGWNLQHPSRPADGFLWDYLRTKPPAVPELLKTGGLSRRANIDTDGFTYRQAIKENGLKEEDYSEILTALDRAPSSFFKRVYLPNPNKAVVETVVQDMKNDATMIKVLGSDLKTRNLTRDCTFCEFFELCQAELRGQPADSLRDRNYYAKENTEE